MTQTPLTILVVGPPQCGKKSLIQSLFKKNPISSPKSSPLENQDDSFNSSSNSIPASLPFQIQFFPASSNTWDRPIQFIFLNNIIISNSIDWNPWFESRNSKDPPFCVLFCAPYPSPHKLESTWKAWKSLIQSKFSSHPYVSIPIVTKCDLSHTLNSSSTDAVSFYNFHCFSIVESLWKNSHLFILHQSDSYINILYQIIQHVLFKTKLGQLSLSSLYSSHLYARGSFYPVTCPAGYENSALEDVFAKPVEKTLESEPQLLIALTKQQFLQEMIDTQQSFLAEQSQQEQSNQIQTYQPVGNSSSPTKSFTPKASNSILLSPVRSNSRKNLKNPRFHSSSPSPLKQSAIETPSPQKTLFPNA